MMKTSALILLGLILTVPYTARAAETVIPAALTFAPQVPPPVNRKTPAVVRVDLTTEEKEGLLMEGFDEGTRYIFWTYNGHVPGPFIRARVGDTLEVHLKNPASSTMRHDIDLHAVNGPGGGAAITLTEPGKESIARFKLLNPGLYVYHCAAPPVTQHIANGMYGLILVEPEGGLPAVDREFYVVQGEFYTKGVFGAEGVQSFDPDKALDERPTYIVFNGRMKSLQEKGALQAKTGETVRVFFGNGGPNLASSWHIIGEIFDRLYREGKVTEPEHNIQTTLVPAGSASWMEFKLEVPGDYSLVDHSIFRIEKGAIGTLHVTGADRPDIYRKLK